MKGYYHKDYFFMKPTRPNTRGARYAKLTDSLTVVMNPAKAAAPDYQRQNSRDSEIYQESEVRPNDKDTERSPVQPRDMKRLRIQNDTLGSPTNQIRHLFGVRPRFGLRLQI